MNKTLLIIICDFLLISILALVEFEQGEEMPVIAESEVRSNAAEEMVELLQLSLEHEAAMREQTEAELAEKAANLDQAEEEKARIADERERLQAQREQLLQEKDALLNQTSELSSNLEATNARLEMTAAERAALAEKLAEENRQRAQLQQELQNQQAALSEREAALEGAQQSLRELEQKQQTLSTQLQVKDTETRILQENLTAARAEVERAQVEAERAREQTEQLATGVSELAASSSALKEEIASTQTVSLNAIFRQFEQSHARVRLTYEVRQLLGTATRTEDIQAVLVDINGQTHALFSAENSPLAPSAATDTIRLTLSMGERAFEVRFVRFMDGAPSVVAIPVHDTLRIGTEARPFALSDDPFRFAKAVIVADDEAGYGEIPIRVPPNEPDFLDVQDRLFERLFGDFSPSTGDFVFAKTGRLMGIMVTRNRARLLQNPQFSESLDWNQTEP